MNPAFICHNRICPRFPREDSRVEVFDASAIAFNLQGFYTPDPPILTLKRPTCRVRVRPLGW